MPRPCHGAERRYADDANFRQLVLFSEYFDGDDGRGVGASHQTGWTALVTSCLETVARQREADAARAEAVGPSNIASSQARSRPGEAEAA